MTENFESRQIHSILGYFCPGSKKCWIIFSRDVHSILFGPVSSDCPARFLDCAFRWSPDCLCKVCCPDVVTTSWLCAGAGWNSSSLSSAPAIALLETHFQFFPVIISCTLATPPILKIFFIMFSNASIKFIECFLEGMLWRTCETRVWCCGHANNGEKMLVQCSTMQIKDLEPRGTLQVGKSHRFLPGHVASQLPILQKQDLTGKCQQIQKQTTKILICVGVPPPTPSFSVYWQKWTFRDFSHMKVTYKRYFSVLCWCCKTFYNKSIPLFQELLCGS